MIKNPAPLIHTHQETKRQHIIGEIPLPFIKLSAKFYNNRVHREFLRRNSYIRSPTPLNQNEGKYIEVCLQNISDMSHLSGKISLTLGQRK